MFWTLLSWTPCKANIVGQILLDKYCWTPCSGKYCQHDLLDQDDGDHRVGNVELPVVDNRVNGYCHGVTRQHLQTINFNDKWQNNQIVNDSPFIIIIRAWNQGLTIENIKKGQSSKSTSWGGTPSVIVLKSTLWYLKKTYEEIAFLLEDFQRWWCEEWQWPVNAGYNEKDSRAPGAAQTQSPKPCSQWF